MHRTSLLKMQSFYRNYVEPVAQDRPVHVLDIGAKSYGGHDSYRHLFAHPRITYTGLDLETGPGVDLVASHPFLWHELDREQFDFCISGQTFEHNPLFWVTFAEIARVLKCSGLACIIAPGSGEVHRYPLDCWRFYPDAWNVLCQYCGMELVETWFEDQGDRRIEPSLMWCDSLVIAQKPVLGDPARRNEFYQRLQTIAQTAVPSFMVPAESHRHGPCLDEYRSRYPHRTQLIPLVQAKWRRVANRFRRRGAA